MAIEINEDPAAKHPPTMRFKPIRLLGWYVVDTDAPIEARYLNTDGVWRGCASKGWWRTREEAESAVAKYLHQWFDCGMLKGVESCRICGTVKNQNNQHKRCKGPVRVSVLEQARTALAQTTESEENPNVGTN